MKHYCVNSKFKRAYFWNKTIFVAGNKLNNGKTKIPVNIKLRKRKLPKTIKVILVLFTQKWDKAFLLRLPVTANHYWPSLSARPVHAIYDMNWPGLHKTSHVASDSDLVELRTRTMVYLLTHHLLIFSWCHALIVSVCPTFLTFCSVYCCEITHDKSAYYTENDVNIVSATINSFNSQNMRCN